ncbi:hypothetical protein EV1_030673 [Malus domestica]
MYIRSSAAPNAAPAVVEAAPFKNASSALSVFELTHMRLCLKCFVHHMYIITCLSYGCALHTNNGAQARMVECQLDSASIKINSKIKP